MLLDILESDETIKIFQPGDKIKNIARETHNDLTNQYNEYSDNMFRAVSDPQENLSKEKFLSDMKEQIANSVIPRFEKNEIEETINFAEHIIDEEIIKFDQIFEDKYFLDYVPPDHKIDNEGSNYIPHDSSIPKKIFEYKAKLTFAIKKEESFKSQHNQEKNKLSELLILQKTLDQIQEGIKILNSYIRRKDSYFSDIEKEDLLKKLFDTKEITDQAKKVRHDLFKTLVRIETAEQFKQKKLDNHRQTESRHFTIRLISDILNPEQQSNIEPGIKPANQNKKKEVQIDPQPHFIAKECKDSAELSQEEDLGISNANEDENYFTKMLDSALKFGIGLLKKFENFSQEKLFEAKELLPKPKHSENGTSPSKCPHNGTFQHFLSFFSDRGK